MDRRHFLAAGSATGAALIGAPALLAQTPAKTTTKGDAAMLALMDAMAQEDLALYPELATEQGLDVGKLAGQRRRLNDNSRAARERKFARAARRLRQFNAVPDRALSEPWRLHRAVVAYAYERQAQGGARYRFGETGGTFDYAPFSPFVISQQTGAYYTVPDFLASQHPVATRADADAWLSRLAALPAVLDADTAGLRADAAAGVLAPDFALDAARAQITALRDYTWPNRLSPSAAVSRGPAGGRYRDTREALGPTPGDRLFRRGDRVSGRPRSARGRSLRVLARSGQRLQDRT